MALRIKEKCAHQFEKLGINIAGFIDNNEKMYKENINNYPIISVKAFKDLNNDDIMIVICSFREREIKQQLLNENIYNFISDTQIDFGGGEEYVLANLDAREKVGIEINDVAREVAEQLGIKTI